MKKRSKKMPSNLCYDWITPPFGENRPPCISIHAGLSDFVQKFTRGSDFFFDPRVIAPLKPSRGMG